MKTLAFIGLGLMGQRMASRLLDAGFALTVWNRDQTKTAALVARGARLAADPAAAAQGADAVLLCVSDTAAVKAVVFGASGVAAGIAAGTLLVDFSSIAPDATRDFAARLQQQTGASWIDAPVSGGTGGAEHGTLAIMAGGNAAAIERLAPVFAPLAARVTRMGEVGAGQVTKVCNQLIVAANSLLIAEAVALAERAGVDPARLAPALAGGFADSKPLQILAPRMASHTHEPVQWKVATLEKDLGNAMALAASCHSPAPLAGQALALMRRHAEAGQAQSDLSTVIDLYRSQH
ncbi:NAD(P)-dependent oxidoreductase [Microvirgula aerodenitrificans]|uniref:NAD(P)-dependent oxidoreductase n=1 Tax=Microvirgula aerodenitrificans TaxID=57480 RepID=UPI00048BA6A7|nr:NAD(P)-dependent oxidoreductase [Microvirgula aerodenitrificans]